MKKMFMCLIVTLMVVLQAYSAFAACCLPSGCQEIVPPELCGEAGGIYEPGSCTEPGVCQATQVSVPTMTEWGMIIFIALAGLGSVYYLRRQTRANS